MKNIMALEKVKFYFTFFFAIRGGESRTFSTSNGNGIEYGSNYKLEG